MDIRINRITQALSCMCILGSTSLSAAIFHEIDFAAPLKCSLSSSQHNRIMVDGGRIKKVIFPDDRLSVKMEEESGQVFIYAQSMIPEETTVSVITDTGLVQDLELRFEGKSSEVVILIEPNQKCEEINYGMTESQSEAEVIASNINTILMGGVPPGYVLCQMKIRLKPKSGVQMRISSKVEGPDEILYIYEIENTSRCKRRVVERVLECAGSRWIFLEKNVVKPKEKIVGIVSVGKHV